MRICKKGDTVDIKAMGTVQKGMPPSVPMAQLEESTVSPSMWWALVCEANVVSTVLWKLLWALL